MHVACGSEQLQWLSKTSVHFTLLALNIKLADTCLQIANGGRCHYICHCILGPFFSHSMIHFWAYGGSLSCVTTSVCFRLIGPVSILVFETPCPYTESQWEYDKTQHKRWYRSLKNSLKSSSTAQLDQIKLQKVYKQKVGIQIYKLQISLDWVFLPGWEKRIYLNEGTSDVQMEVSRQLFRSVSGNGVLNHHIKMTLKAPHIYKGMVP
jgi:hypothetical protein